MGLLVAFEGADNSGKSTMIEFVRNHLIDDRKLTVTKFKFPDYIGNSGSLYGTELYRMLNDEPPSRFKEPEFVTKFIRLQILDKYHAIDYLKILQEKYDVVLLDRFLLSSIIYDIMHSMTVLQETKLTYREDTLDTILSNNKLPIIEDAWNMTFPKIYTEECKEKLSVLLETFSDIPHVVFDKQNSKIFLDMVRSKNRVQDGLDVVQPISQRIIEKLYADMCNVSTKFKNFKHVCPIVYNRYFGTDDAFNAWRIITDVIKPTKYDHVADSIREIHDHIHQTIDNVSFSICEKICNYIVNFEE